MTARPQLCLVGAMVAGLTALLRVNAASFELITEDTYLSPTVLRTALSSAKARGYRVMFWTNSFNTGVENHYQYRDEYDNSTNLVGGVSSNLYYRDFQLETAYTRRSLLETRGNHSASVVPIDRYRAAIGYYFPTANAQSRTDAAKPEAARPTANEVRVMLGWTEDRRRDGRYVGEGYVDVSLKWIPNLVREHVKFFKEFSGSYLYSWRPAINQHFLGFAFRAGLLEWRDGSKVCYNVNFGGSRTGPDWNWGAFQHQVVVSYAGLHPRVTVETGFGLTRDINRGRWNHQFAVVAKYDLFSKLVRVAR